MKILVTGSGGYIGNSFIRTFAEKYDFIKFSLLHETLDDSNMNQVDGILHCAALVHQARKHDYSKYYEINVEYPVSLARKAKKSGVKQFIFISTIAVYGEDKELLEENMECNPATPYGKSKLEAEQQLKELGDENFIISVIRPPMVYGKDAPGNISSLISLIEKVPILPFGKINNKRSFTYIGNLVHLIDNVIEQNAPGIFLAADDNAISTNCLIRLISKELKKKVYLVRIPLFDTLLSIIKPTLHRRLFENLEVDNTITKQTLNFENPYSVEEGIKNMIQGEKHDTVL